MKRFFKEAWGSLLLAHIIWGVYAGLILYSGSQVPWDMMAIAYLLTIIYIIHKTNQFIREEDKHRARIKRIEESIQRAEDAYKEVNERFRKYKQ
jgi:predicted RND superfamily exporter protein